MKPKEIKEVDPIKEKQQITEEEKRMAQEQEEAFLKMQELKLKGLYREHHHRIEKQLSDKVVEKDESQLDNKIPVWKLLNIGDNILYQIWVIERDLKNTYHYTEEKIKSI